MVGRGERAAIAVVLVCGIAAAALRGLPAQGATEAARLAELAPAAAAYIDAHIHMDEKDAADAAALVVQAMGRLNGTRAVIQTEPYGPGNPAAWDIETVLGAVKAHAGRLSLAGGGGTLNPMLLEAYRTGDAGPEARRRLRERAEAILRQGAVGFGELSNEHFVLPTAPVKDYEHFPADAPLMLLLADIAAEHDVPIVLHMEAVPRDMPSGLPPPNPPMLHANIEALERLLSHNPKTRLIWAHAGSDNTGFRTPGLMRRLLKAHSNLYMEIKYDPGALGRNPPVADGALKPDWLQLFADFPDRFILGSDQHYDPPSTARLTRAQAGVSLLNLLPAPLRQQIAVDNPTRIYRLRP
jgi:predicted TIM-barrel fold metal-dependent hydrolase